MSATPARRELRRPVNRGRAHAGAARAAGRLAVGLLLLAGIGLAGAIPALALGVLTTFEGLAAADVRAIRSEAPVPPDANLAVGPSHVFQIVNEVGRVTDKRGQLVSQFSLQTFFGVDPGFDETDPRVIYDAPSGRWLATYTQSSTGQTSSSILLAVSTTSDPAGTYCRYHLGNPTAERFIQDFPILGVSDDKVVVSYQAFDFAGDQPFLGVGSYVISKASLLDCGTLSVTRVPPDPALDNAHPAHSLTSTATLFMPGRPVETAAAVLTLLAVNGVPGGTSVTSTSTSLTIRAWRSPPDAPQPGTMVQLDTGDRRVQSAAWQNGSLWLAGNEACTPAGDTAVRSCLRVIEVRTDTLTVRQDITFGAVGQYYVYPAIRPDSAGNLFVVFSHSSTTDFAGVRVTARLATDPPGTLRPSNDLRAGAGAQTDIDPDLGTSRMGDYSGAAVDPVDPGTVWVTGEYVRSTADRDWGTSVAALMFPLASPTLSFRLSKQGAASSAGLQFKPGDTLQVDVTVSNPGPALIVDVFFGALLPPPAGPALGCPGGDPVAFFVDNLTRAVLTCLSQAPQTFPPLFQRLTLSANLPPTTIVNFFNFVWRVGAPNGTYTLFGAVTPPGAFADGSLGPTQFTAVTTSPVDFAP